MPKKLSPEALLKENQQLKKIITSLPVNVYWKNKEGYYQGCSETQAKALNLPSSEDIVGKTLNDLGILQGLEEIIKNDEQVLNNGETLTIEEELNHKDVGTRYYLSKKIPLKDKNGDIEGLLGISVDITKHKKLEQELKVAKARLEGSEKQNQEYVAKLSKQVTGEQIQGIPESVENISEYLENIIANVPGHIYWLDRNNVYLGCNDEQAESVGLKSRKDIVGKRNADLSWAMEASNLDELNERVMSTGEPHIAEELCSLPGDVKVIYLSKKVPLRNKKGKVIGMLGVSVDITKQKKLEEDLKAAKEAAEAANVAKTMFIEDASHNARTPLASIYGAKELFRVHKHQFSAEQQEWIEILDESVLRFQDMIERILDFSRIEGGHFKIKQEPIDIRQFVQHTVDSVQTQAEEKGLALRVNVAEDVPGKIVSDEYCLNSVLLNLLSNALKFTKEGSIITDVSRDKDRLKVAVTDTGCGIKEENLQQIFERFSKVVPSTSSDNQGYGLGLSTVEYMAKHLAGEISVESELGKGSTFTLSIPLVEAKHD
jgi:PAS domain S-box-containing protein